MGKREIFPCLFKKDCSILQPDAANKWRRISVLGNQMSDMAWCVETPLHHNQMAMNIITDAENVRDWMTLVLKGKAFIVCLWGGIYRKNSAMMPQVTNSSGAIWWSWRYFCKLYTILTLQLWQQYCTDRRNCPRWPSTLRCSWQHFYCSFTGSHCKNSNICYIRSCRLINHWWNLMLLLKLHYFTFCDQCTIFVHDAPNLGRIDGFPGVLKGRRSSAPIYGIHIEATTR